MKQINSYLREFEDLDEFLNQDKSILDELKKEIDSDYLDNNEFLVDSLSEMIDLIREGSSSYEEDREDRDYIYYTYGIKTENYIFEVCSSSYIKDHTICDEDFTESIYVINKKLKKIEEQSKKNKKIEKNNSTWLDFFENKSLDELKAELLKYKFPKKN